MMGIIEAKGELFELLSYLKTNQFNSQAKYDKQNNQL